MTMKDLFQDVQIFKQKIEEKRILMLIKAIDEKLSSLQKLAQEMNSNFVSKINESDQQHVKIVRQKDS